MNSVQLDASVSLASVYLAVLLNLSMKPIVFQAIAWDHVHSWEAAKSYQSINFKREVILQQVSCYWGEPERAPH